MTDKDYAPLTTSCIRSLNDKLYEKRKVAALEIERFAFSETFTKNQFSTLHLYCVLSHFPCFHFYNKFSEKLALSMSAW